MVELRIEVVFDPTGKVLIGRADDGPEKVDETVGNLVQAIVGRYLHQLATPRLRDEINADIAKHLAGLSSQDLLRVEDGVWTII